MQDSPDNPHRSGGGTNDGAKPKGYRKPGQGKPKTDSSDTAPSEGSES